MEEENIQKPVRKTGKMKKIERKIAKLTKENQVAPKESLTKKIAKLEKKKMKHKKWLSIKLPVRILIKGVITWGVIGVTCYACSYVPIVKEVKSMATAAIAYVAPKSVGTVVDVATLNFGANNKDYEWLKNTIVAYVSETTKIEFITEADEQYVQYSDQQEKTEELAQEVFGTTNLQDLSPTDIVNKLTTNSTPEIVSQLVQVMNLTEESKKTLEQDLNRALKILPKLNTNQMNELIDLITGTASKDGLSDSTRETAQEACDNLLEEIRKTGVISQKSYQKCAKIIEKAGCEYPLEIVVQIAGMASSQNENDFYSLDTDQIENSLSLNGEYLLNQGDIVSLNVGQFIQASGIVLKAGE